MNEPSETSGACVIQVCAEGYLARRDVDPAPGTTSWEWSLGWGEKKLAWRDTRQQAGALGVKWKLQMRG